jgi:diguanylate cyclase (GGDEF)-like protein/PAS domain S-box-containing protein
MRKVFQPFRDLPIKWKLVLEISLLVAVISVFFVLYFPQRQKQVAIRGLENKAISLAEMMAYSSNAGVEFEDLNSVEAVFMSVQGDPDLRDAKVLKGNSIFALHAPTDEDVPTLSEVPSHTDVFYQDGLLNVVTPVVSGEGRRIGSLQLDFSLERIQGENTRSILATLAASSGILALGIFSAFFIGKRVASPIRELQTSVESVANGNFNTHLTIDSYDEIGRLGRAFQLMTEKIRYLTQNLEAEVKKRTQELEMALAERRRAEEALRESGMRLPRVADGLWDWDLKADVVYFSPRWKSMLGYHEREIGDSPDEWLNRIHPDERDRVKAEVTAHIEGLLPQFESEHRILHKDGTYRWMLCRGLAVREAGGKAYRAAGSQTDTTARKTAEAQLQHHALYDELTDLPNRTLLMNRLERLIERVKRHPDYLFAMLFLDLDHFKVVNDSLGHMVGDQLLIAVAQRLGECLRPGDTVARLGGDEFTILLDGINRLSDAQRIAERIHETLMSPFDLEGREVFTSASIGVVLSDTGYDQPEDFLRNADLAMYHAKAEGRARHEVFDKQMHAEAMVRLQLETDLRRAIEQMEFRLHYQPIVSLESGKLTGFEALVRWHPPGRGLISPAEFIPAAEETGLIIPIGQWVLQEACSQMKIWQKQFPANPPLTISVNLSPKQFTQPSLVEQIDETLHEVDLDPHCLKLEITETLIMESIDFARDTFLQLKALAIQLQMDDFGTGYSSLSYLHRFPIDGLKIDRSFVSRIGEDGENLEIVRTIALLAHNLGMGVTSEGVETAEQMAQLRELKCEYGQGYFFAKPLGNEAASALISEAPQW